MRMLFGSECLIYAVWSTAYLVCPLELSRPKFKIYSKRCAVRGDNMIARGSYLAAGRGVHLVNSRPTAGQNMIALC